MSGAGEMTCRELVEVITEYLEGTLADPERARFEEHLGDCRSCATYLDQMRATIAALGELRGVGLRGGAGGAARGVSRVEAPCLSACNDSHVGADTPFRG